jgi:2-methylcitrate synthase
MNKIKTPNKAKNWINNAINKKHVIMGFGHRVYKSGDSRVPTMKKHFLKVAKIKKDKKLHKIYDTLEEVMVKRKGIYPNMDFPSGPTYHLMVLILIFFTPIFVIAG